MIADRRRGSLSLLLALCAANVHAQPGTGARPAAAPAGTERIAVLTLRAPAPALGAAAADTLGAAIRRSLAAHREAVALVPRVNIAATLEASGFPPDKPPDRVTAYLLARNLRASQYVQGSVSPTPAGVRIETELVLGSNDQLVQPLPVVEGRSVAEAAAGADTPARRGAQRDEITGRAARERAEAERLTREHCR
jgi:hypothetical protein